jgi:hypothetical protein
MKVRAVSLRTCVPAQALPRASGMFKLPCLQLHRLLSSATPPTIIFDFPTFIELVRAVMANQPPKSAYRA